MVSASEGPLPNTIMLLPEASAGHFKLVLCEYAAIFTKLLAIRPMEDRMSEAFIVVNVGCQVQAYRSRAEPEFLLQAQAAECKCVG
ncbi:MAG: hypothetical protein OSJ64_08280, partial [Firmicutes bacterium]|nr:hypothetical protein [Bacillota bacterium]